MGDASPGLGAMGSGAASGAAAGTAIMPGWGTAIGAGVGLLGSFMSASAGGAAIEAQKKVALEQARRANLGNQNTLGEGNALAAASGVEFNANAPADAPQGSLQMHLANMGNEFRRQNDWAVEQANTGADISSLANTTNLFSGIGSTFNRYAAANNWFQSKPAG